MADRISSQTTVQRNAGRRVRKANSTVAKDPNQTSGTSPTPDFVVENHFTIFLLRPVTPAAFTWIEEHLPEDRLTFGNAVCVEHRFIADIVRGAIADGLVVRS